MKNILHGTFSNEFPCMEMFEFHLTWISLKYGLWSAVDKAAIVRYGIGIVNILRPHDWYA